MGGAMKKIKVQTGRILMLTHETERLLRDG